MLTREHRLWTYSPTAAASAALTSGIRVAPPVKTTESISAYPHLACDPTRKTRIHTKVKLALSRASKMGCTNRSFMSAQTVSNAWRVTFMLKSMSSNTLSTFFFSFESAIPLSRRCEVNTHSCRRFGIGAQDALEALSLLPQLHHCLRDLPDLHTMLMLKLLHEYLA